MSRTAAVPLLALISCSQSVHFATAHLRRRCAVGEDGAPGLWSRRGQEKLEDLFEVADERDVGADVLVDLGGVDLDVDLLRGGSVAGEVAGDAVVEAHAEGEQEVGLLDGVVDPGLAVHAHHAE